jgi:hypothetical protein
MLVAGTAMPASAKNPYLIDEIAFLHVVDWLQIYLMSGA